MISSNIKLGNGKYKTFKWEKSLMLTTYRATELYSKGSSEKFTCVNKTWTEQDLDIFFLKQFCIEKHKAYSKKKFNCQF